VTSPVHVSFAFDASLLTSYSVAIYVDGVACNTISGLSLALIPNEYTGGPFTIGPSGVNLKVGSFAWHQYGLGAASIVPLRSGLNILSMLSVFLCDVCL
jgi:hypothetical protein